MSKAAAKAPAAPKAMSGMMEDDPGWQYLRKSADELLSAQTQKFDSKKDVWIADKDEGFVHAQIKSSKGDMVTVVTVGTNLEKTVKKDDAQQQNPPKFDKTEDMANLTFLNDASVLMNLKARYAAMMIYTYSGLFCVVINPYKRLPIYSESVVKMFMGKRRNEMPPHLFAVADEAYRNMQADRENQSMLITGESGAGKTENTKKVISYFAVVGTTQTKKVALEPGQKPQVGLEDQIVMTNPVLEAFGNAKTVRNNNSSRFGKFIRIHFAGNGKLAGADIEHYLLEKSRVMKQSPGERCYHIFYQIMSGGLKGLKEKLLLDRPLKEYHSVAQAELTIEGMDDAEEMQITDESFNIMLFSEEEKFNLFKLCAGIMHMSLMKFKQRPREEQAEPEDIKEGDLASKLFGNNPEGFVTAFCKPRVKVGAEWVNKGQNLEQVNWAIGALARAIYARMFTWLIKRCNKTLDAQDLPRDFFIGVLDIAGFEIFDFNSFEQLWINFVNEKLQQFFNHHMFVLEQEEYKREGIVWEFIDFGLDLQSCIELIEKPMGVISMLDEECVVPKGSDLSYADKMNDQHLGKHPNFEKPKPPKGKQAIAHFAIRHYAGTVRYNVTAWLEKNKDPLNDTTVNCLKEGTGNQLIHDIWADYRTQEEAAAGGDSKKGGGKKKGKSASFMTVSMMYRESLNNLMNMLRQTHPHFIRCIIPNELKKSGYIDSALVLNQLTCNGVLEGIRICRKGFPNRLNYPDFKQRYAVLAADAAKGKPDPKDAGTAIGEALLKNGSLKPEMFQFGATKIFFKAGVLAHLEDLRDETLGKIITKFQCACRHYSAQCEYKRRLEQQVGLDILQRNIRAWCTLRTWPWFKLYGAVKPLLKGAKADEEYEAMEKKCKELEESYQKEEKLRKELEEANSKMLQEKNDLFLQLEQEKDMVSEGEERAAKLLAQKSDLEKQLAGANDNLGDHEEKNNQLQKANKKQQQENEALKKNIGDLETTIKKQETEKQSKDHQLRSLQDEIQAQDEAIGKVNKEKKHQEEVNRKLTEDIQAEEDKVNHLNKVKAKLEQTLDEVEENLERERRSRADVEKGKRKVEGDLKVAQESADELQRHKLELEGQIKKRDGELAAMAGRLDDEQSLVAKLQRTIKELQARISELEEELEAERQARSKAEKSRSEMQRELEDLGDRLDEAGGATQAQLELNKKRENDFAKLRRDLEEQNMNHENSLAAMRKKHNDSVAELGDQLEQIQKSKQKIEHDKSSMQREMEDLHAALDAEAKQHNSADKMAKQLEVQLTEIQLKSDDLARQVADLTSQKSRFQGEISDLSRQLEDAESQASNVHRVKLQLTSQLEETKRQADQEGRERQSLAGQVSNYQLECQQLRDSLEEIEESKSDVLRQLSKAHAEAQQWRAKYEGEGANRGEELEETKRKLQARVTELQDTLDASNLRIQHLDRSKHKIQCDLEDAQVEADRANGLANALEKKQKGFDKVIDDWKRKCDAIVGELEAAQRDTRNASTEAFKLKSQLDESFEQMEGLRRENKALSQELKDMSDQLGEGGKSVHELQKIRRRLELEKDEMQQALDDAESALEGEESKVLRMQVELTQVRSEIEKRLQEKEEEFEHTRKNHQRAIDSMQASLESEARGRADLLRMKKKLESDINELEIALDHANKANVDAQKNIKRYHEQIKELQMQIEDDQRLRDELRDQVNMAERRCALLQSEKDDLALNSEQLERARRQAEAEALDARESNNNLNAQLNHLSGAKRKAEAELIAVTSELEETLSELKGNEERSKKAMMDAARLADELRQEQEHSQNVDRQRKSLEQAIKEMQVRLDEAEAAALKGGKKTIQKLEQKLGELGSELDSECRRHQESQKNLRTKDRRCRELQFQVDEDKKGTERMYELVEKLQGKIKTYKKQVEEAEQLAGMNLGKYRQLQHQLEDAEERADSAENNLAKMRHKGRNTLTVQGGLSHSLSTSHIRSRSRTPFSSTDHSQDV